MGLTKTSNRIEAWEAADPFISLTLLRAILPIQGSVTYPQLIKTQTQKGQPEPQQKGIL